MKYIIAFFFLLATVQMQAQKQDGQLSTHILDIGKGLPATGVTVELEKMNEKNNTWCLVDKSVTDSNGRIPNFLNKNIDNDGIYKLVFRVADYFKSNHTESFYPFIEVVFQIKGKNHFHVPITLSPFGYSTYRGS